MNADQKNPPQPEDKKDVLLTPEGEEIDLSITGTLKIDPESHTPIKNKDRLSALKFAVAGLLYLLVKERSIRFATAATIIIVILGVWLRIGTFSWALLVLAVGAVWVTEALNTAIEASINIGAPQPHPMAKVGKDVAAAASLVCVLVLLIIAALILVPPLLNRLSATG